MKILHVSHSSTQGGAARAAYRIHLAQRENGIESRMLVPKSENWHPEIITTKSDLFGVIRRTVAPLLDAAMARLQIPSNDGLHSPGLFSSLPVKQINRSDADVVHLHWVQGGTLSIFDIARIRKPLVWTLHDVWAFSGTEHYYNKPRRWAESYSRSSRPSQDRGLDLSRTVWKLKKVMWRSKFQLVAPSNWMGRCIAESALMAGWPVSVIPNPIDHHQWFPVAKQTARSLLGISETSRVVAFGALGLGGDSRKGFDFFESSIPLLTQKIKNVEIIVFGPLPKNWEALQAQGVKFLGQLMDDLTLRVVYSSADVFVITSRQDNLPNTGLEALACGTPVVAFEVGGIGDIVTHLETGYLAEPFDVADLVRGIEHVLLRENLSRMSKRARERALRAFSPKVVSEKYLEIYRRVLAS